MNAPRPRCGCHWARHSFSVSTRLHLRSRKSGIEAPLRRPCISRRSKSDGMLSQTRHHGSCPLRAACWLDKAAYTMLAVHGIVGLQADIRTRMSPKHSSSTPPRSPLAFPGSCCGSRLLSSRHISCWESRVWAHKNDSASKVLPNSLSLFSPPLDSLRHWSHKPTLSSNTLGRKCCGLSCLVRAQMVLVQSSRIWQSCWRLL